MFGSGTRSVLSGQATTALPPQLRAPFLYSRFGPGALILGANMNIRAQIFPIRYR